MAKKTNHPAIPGNEKPAAHSGKSGEHINDIKKLELQHLVLNKLLNSNKKSSKPAIPGHEILQKDMNQ
ncbi:MAG: hypothetical protein Q8M08_06010 [Bacteroidales bacterium]|nr:hypothetical protein [Bacteroidales bacterium]